MSNVLVSVQEQEYLQIIEDLNKARGDGLKVGLKTRLHDGQIEVLAPLYDKKCSIDTLFLPCARKFGKSELAAYVLWRHALFNPGSACYYIGPEAAHARKIMWDLQRFQKFMGPETRKYISSTKNQEMKLGLVNGSFIQIMGSDNWAAGNGLTPSIVVYDEMKVFHPQWHVEFSPNRAAKAAPLIVIGTLPKVGDKNMDQYNSLLEYAQKDPRSRVFFKTTWDNPINHLPSNKSFIEAEIARLRLRGDEDIVQREYYSKIVLGGKSAIFPMLSEKHVKPHHEVYEEVKRDLKKLEWYVVADPGNTTCFAVLFAALNPWTKKLYLLNEMYVTDQMKTTTRSVCNRICKESLLLYPEGNVKDDWFKVADEAAAWFITEAMAEHEIYFSPTDKRHGDKEEGLGVIKDQLLHNTIVISDKCKHLYKEMQHYAKDQKGNIPKKNDHLIDCFRYLNQACNYDSHTTVQYVKNIDPIVDGRFRHMHDRQEEGINWEDDIESDYWE